MFVDGGDFDSSYLSAPLPKDMAEDYAHLVEDLTSLIPGFEPEGDFPHITFLKLRRQSTATFTRIKMLAEIASHLLAGEQLVIGGLTAQYYPDSNAPRALFLRVYETKGGVTEFKGRFLDAMGDQDLATDNMRRTLHLTLGDIPKNRYEGFRAVQARIIDRTERVGWNLLVNRLALRGIREVDGENRVSAKSIPVLKGPQARMLGEMGLYSASCLPVKELERV